jgi:hypothetical protein
MMRSRYLDSTPRSRALSTKATRAAGPNPHPNERLRERRIRLSYLPWPSCQPKGSMRGMAASAMKPVAHKANGALSDARMPPKGVGYGQTLTSA